MFEIDKSGMNTIQINAESHCPMRAYLVLVHVYCFQFFFLLFMCADHNTSKCKTSGSIPIIYTIHWFPFMKTTFMNQIYFYMMSIVIF